MKRNIFFLLLLFTLNGAFAQTDISKVVADPNTTIFSDGQNTVAGYVYEELQAKTKCCGEDAIYVEVKINSEGRTQSVRALSGNNECYKKSVADIIMPIRWDASKISGTKTIYIEVKPNLACKGNRDDNLYVKLDYGIPAPITEIPETTDKPATNPTEEKKEETPAAETSASPETTASNTTSEEVTKQEPPKDTIKIKPKLPSDLPKPKYVSKGDLKPDKSHLHSYANLPGPTITTPVFVEGTAGEAKFIRRKLKEQGICGFVHVLAEITIDKDGSVVDHVILKVNRNDVLEKIPAVLHSLKYQPSSVPFRTRSYVEFKSDITCGENAPKVDIKKVPDYIYTEDEGPYGKVMEAEPPARPTQKNQGDNNTPEELALPIDE